MLKNFFLSILTSFAVLLAATAFAQNTLESDVPASSQPSSYATIYGVVKDAVTGDFVSNALVSIAGRTGRTDSQGNYRISDIPPATLEASFTADITSGDVPLEVTFQDLSSDSAHTLEASRDGYSDYVNPSVQLHSGETRFDFSMSPIMSDGMRFVLNWSDLPRDLDIHLRTPVIEGRSHHIYWNSRGSRDSAPYADLDQDVVTGRGPETMTIHRMFSGTYYVYVYLYADYGNGTLPTSEASVQVYNDRGLLQTVVVPSSGSSSARYWNIGKVDGDTGRFTLVNQLQSSAPVNALTNRPFHEPVQEKPAAPHRVSSWHWSFGDGATSSSQHPTHTYTSAGTYTVKLTVTNSEGQSNTRTRYGYITAESSELRALYVNSVGATGVFITASPSAYSGTTNYMKDMIEDGTTITLTAPATSGGANLLSWTGCSYQQGPACTVIMSSNKTVTANYTVTSSYTVTAIAGQNGSVTPSSRTVSSGSRASFTVTPSQGYTHGAVGGTCPTGSFSGNIYATGAITSNCSVSFTFQYGGNDDPVSSLYFPHIATTEGWRSEIGIVNTGPSQMTGTLKGFSGTGQQVYSTSVSLPVYGRMEQDVTQSDIQYMRLDIASGYADGFQKFSIPNRYRVGLEAIHSPLEGALYVPHIASDNRWWTGVAVANTENSTKYLPFLFNNGQQQSVTLAPGEQNAFLIRNMFGGQAQPNLRSARVDNASGLVGLMLFGDDNSLSGVSFGNERARRLVFPHVHADEYWWTGHAVYNPNADPANLTVKVYSASGEMLYQSTAFVPGNSNLVTGLYEGMLPAGSAWFTIDSTQPLIGFELFGTNRGEQLAGYSVVNLGTRQGIFPKIDHSGWTGIAFVNASGASTTVRLEARSDDGQIIATSFMQLGNGEKKVGFASDLFGVSIDSATYIGYYSDREIVGFQLNGSINQTMLDGIPALKAYWTPYGPSVEEEAEESQE